MIAVIEAQGTVAPHLAINASSAIKPVTGKYQIKIRFVVFLGMHVNFGHFSIFRCFFLFCAGCAVRVPPGPVVVNGLDGSIICRVEEESDGCVREVQGPVRSCHAVYPRVS